MPRKAIDMVGQVFGDYTVIRRDEQNTKHLTKWICKCSGCDTEHSVTRINLVSGASNRCGNCRYKRNGEMRKVHGHAGKHDKTPEYQSWRSMKDRCLNPDSSNYIGWGGRGITICQEWIERFEQFLADMGPKPGKSYTLDRIDNEGPYCKSNCKWSTKKEQSRNQRSNVIVTYHGYTGVLVEVCEHFELPCGDVRRLKWDRTISWVEALDIVFSRTHGSECSAPIHAVL